MIFTEVADGVGELDYLHKLPTLEEIDSNYKFDVDLKSNCSGKGSWLYSGKMKKVFVKNRSPLNIFPSYTPVSEGQCLFLRAMIVPVSQEDSTIPLTVCPNHRAAEPFNADNNAHILRCNHPGAMYDGTEDGYYFHNRLQVVLPLNKVAPNEPISYMFLCQNSCSGGMQRKATAIIFTLEDECRNILGKRILNFKVCSCPKRDKEKEEKEVKELPKKRKSEVQIPTSSKKLPRIKTEPGAFCSQSSTDSQSETYDTIKMEMAFPNKEIAAHVVDCAFNAIAAKIQTSTDRNEVEGLKKLQTKYIRNKGEIHSHNTLNQIKSTGSSKLLKPIFLYFFLPEMLKNGFTTL